MATFGARQRGNVTRAQLLAAGFSTKVVRRCLANGSLHERFPGVYAVGYMAAAPLAVETAAILYCGAGAMLSHRTATRLWAVPAPRITEVEVTLVGRQRPSRRGLRIHSIDGIRPAELRRRDGLPITSPSLTLLDLAGVAAETTLAAALNEARVQKLVNDRQLLATLGAHPNRRGARALRSLLRSEEAEFVTESEAERRCLRLMLEHGLKPDAAQARIGPYRIDFLFELERLVVEVDGYRYHRTRERFVRDRRRRADLMARGYEVFVVSWADLTEDAATCMNRLQSVRAQRRALALRERRPPRADLA